MSVEKYYISVFMCLRLGLTTNFSDLLSRELVISLSTTGLSLPHTEKMEQYFQVSSPDRQHHMPVKQ